MSAKLDVIPIAAPPRLRRRRPAAAPALQAGPLSRVAALDRRPSREHREPRRARCARLTRREPRRRRRLVRERRLYGACPVRLTLISSDAQCGRPSPHSRRTGSVIVQRARAAQARAAGRRRARARGVAARGLRARRRAHRGAAPLPARAWRSSRRRSYAEGITELEQAYEIFPHPNVAFNVATRAGRGSGTTSPPSALTALPRQQPARSRRGREGDRRSSRQKLAAQTRREAPAPTPSRRSPAPPEKPAEVKPGEKPPEAKPGENPAAGEARREAAGAEARRRRRRRRRARRDRRRSAHRGRLPGDGRHRVARRAEPARRAELDDDHHAAGHPALRASPASRSSCAASRAWTSWRSPAATTNVSMRGFNSRLANKLLVLVNGRSVYNDILGSTFWETFTIDVDQIERIEVVRGPGSALYGADAFAGVVNIITIAPGEGKDGLPRRRRRRRAGLRLGAGSSGARATSPTARRSATRATRAGRARSDRAASTSASPTVNQNLGAENLRVDLRTHVPHRQGQRARLRRRLRARRLDVYGIGPFNDYVLARRQQRRQRRLQGQARQRRAPTATASPRQAGADYQYTRPHALPDRTPQQNSSTARREYVERLHASRRACTTTSTSALGYRLKNIDWNYLASRHADRAPRLGLRAGHASRSASKSSSSRSGRVDYVPYLQRHRRLAARRRSSSSPPTARRCASRARPRSGRRPSSRRT